MSELDPSRKLDPADLARINKTYGLDKPWYIQFVKFSKGFFIGDRYGWPGLGYTYAGQTSVKALIIANVAVFLVQFILVLAVVGFHDRDFF